MNPSTQLGKDHKLEPSIPLKIPKFIRGGLITIVALMPFHAFLVILAGHVFGHLTIWQAWKEFIILLMLVAAMFQALKDTSTVKRLKNPTNLAAASYITIALLVSFLVGRDNQTAFWFGIKTDLVFIFLFLLAQIVTTRSLKITLAKILLATSTIVAILGLVQAWILPHNFLLFFGYGPSTIRPVQLIDPAIEAIRIFSTLGGPNQLGAFLILPLCFTVSLMLRRYRLWQPLLALILSLALVETFSRSAWIGAIVGVAFTIAVSLGKKGLILAGSIVFIVLIGFLILLPHLSAKGQLQYYLLHSRAGVTTTKTSNPLHVEAVSAGLEVIKNHPLGLGLGSAGPASFHGPNGFIPENYYLQVAVESGLAGLVAFLIFQFLVAIKLFQLRHAHGLAIPLLGALIGVSLVNLLLHGWADSTLAYVYWILAGAVIGLPAKNQMMQSSSGKISLNKNQATVSKLETISYV